MANELIGYLGSLSILSGTSTAMVNEACSDSGDGLRFQVTSSSKQYLDPRVPVIVKIDGGAVTTGYTIEHAGGYVVFTTDRTGEEHVTVSCSYFASVAENVGAFHKYKISVNINPLDSSKFGDAWETCVAGMKSWTLDAEKYFVDESLFDLLVAGNILLIKPFLNTSSAVRYEGYGLITKDDIDNASPELIKENLSIKGFNGLYFRD